MWKKGTDVTLAVGSRAAIADVKLTTRGKIKIITQEFTFAWVRFKHFNKLNLDPVVFLDPEA